MYIPFKSRTHRQQRTKQPGLLVRICKRGISGGICLADAARALLYKHSGNDAKSQSQNRSSFSASAPLPLGPSLYNEAHNRATVPLLPDVPSRAKAPSSLISPRFIRMLDDRHRYVFAERQNFSLGATSATDDVDRISRAAREALDYINFPSDEDLGDPCSETCEVSEAQLPGKKADSVAGTADSTEVQQGSEHSLAGDRKSVALDRSQHRRVSEESEKTLVNTSAKGSRSPSVEEEEPLRLPSTREPLIDTAVAGPREDKADFVNYRGPQEVAALLERAVVRLQSLQQENVGLKAANEALHAQNIELMWLKETSEDLNDAYEQRLTAGTREKAQVEQWLVEETTEVVELEQQLVDVRNENFALVQRNCQQAKKATGDMAQSKAFERPAFERMILLYHMLTHFGVDTRGDDHEEISCQALDIVGADERIISAGFAAQAGNALEEQAKPEAVELRRQREIEHMEDRMADVLADGNFSTCRYDGRWVNMRTGDEIRKREEVGGKGKNLENKSADSVDEIVQDPRWMPSMKVYHHFWKDSSTPSPTKAELEDVYKEDGNDKCLMTAD